MIKYNLVIVENKQCIPFLNLTEQAFYNKLWEWAYEDALWEYLETTDPTDEELEQELPRFINENIFHKYKYDEIDCFAFIVEDSVKEYQADKGLLEFIYSKIEDWMLHLEDEEYESEDEEREAYDQACEEWKCDCSIDSEEMSLKDLQDYIPGGPTSEDDLPEIIYDERKHD